MQELESRVVTGAADTAELDQARAHVVSLEAQLAQMTKAGAAAELDLKGTPSFWAPQKPSACIRATCGLIVCLFPRVSFPTAFPTVLIPYALLRCVAL
jgi:hypothetical protein